MFTKQLKKIILIVVVAGVLVYLYNNQDLLFVYKRIGWLDAFYLTLATWGSFLMLAYQFMYFMRIFDIQLRFREYFGLTVVNTMFSYFVPARGGLIARAFYLNKVHDFPYSKYLAFTGGAYFLNISVSVFVSLIVQLCIWLLTGQVYKKLVLVCVGLGGGLLVFIILLNSIDIKRFVGRKTKITRIIASVLDGIDILTKNKKNIFYASINYVGLILFFSLRLYVAFLALGVDISMLHVALIQSLVALSLVLSVTPGNIGIKEGIIGLIGSSMGYEIEVLMASAALDRAFALLFTFAFGTIYSKLLIGSKEQDGKNK